MPVKSPYNFVPAPGEDQVYTPDWADQVSHDIPFSDGECGTIEFSITAHTPIFIRNGHAQGEATNEFCHMDTPEGKKYFIPATSIKGMIRNVVEIITSSRMIQVNNHRHAVRQIMRPTSYIASEGYSLTNSSEKRKIRAGWLIKKEEKYFIYDCGAPLKIRYPELDRFFADSPGYNTSFEAQFGDALKSDMNRDFSARTAKYKYETILQNQRLEQHFKIHPLLEPHEQKWKSRFQHLDYVLFADEDESEFEGHIVCTGQASSYPSSSTSRKGEYVFKGRKTDTLMMINKRLEVGVEVMDTFLFINRHGLKDELDDWTFWKDKIHSGIPVFFRKTENGQGVKDFGLTFMYKQPVGALVKKSYPLNTYPSDPKKEDYSLDWAETIFGHTHKNKALKGRAFFSHGFYDDTDQKIPVKLPEQKVVLSSPRSSYYPFYMIQNDRGDGKTVEFNTYNHNPSLSGYKRYPVKGYVSDRNASGREEMTSCFIPLDKGTTFNAKLKYFNLKKPEIGALLSAMTFHGSTESFAHSIGYAKPFGYGKVKIEVKNLSRDVITQYLKSFEYQMGKKQRAAAHRKRAIRELLAMAADAAVNIQDQLNYPDLGDFATYKAAGDFLHRYSSLTGTSFDFDNILSEADVVNFAKAAAVVEQKIQQFRKEEEQRKAIQAQQEKERVLLAIREEKEQSEKNDFEAAIRSTVIQELENFKAKYPESKYLFDIDRRIRDLRDRKKIEKEEQAIKDIYSTTSYKWDDVAFWPKDKLKRIKDYQFTSTQKKDIEAAIRQCFLLESGKPDDRKNKFFKRGKLMPQDKFPWTDIKKWLDEPTVEQLYHDFKNTLNNP